MAKIQILVKEKYCGCEQYREGNELKWDMCGRHFSKMQKKMLKEEAKRQKVTTDQEGFLIGILKPFLDLFKKKV